VVFVLTALSLWVNLGHCLYSPWLTPLTTGVASGVSWVWSAYNLLMLGIALLILLDAPRPSPYEWFSVRRIARAQLEGQRPKPCGVTPPWCQRWGPSLLLPSPVV
jgi:cellulose synthase (UDP-forming)